jgi:hypothetical protein
VSLKEVSLPRGGKAWVATRATHAQTKALYRAQYAAAQEPGEALDLQTAGIRTFTVRWDGVHDPNTDDELSFPADLDRLDQEDASALFKAINAALTEGRADPNAGS